MSFNTSLSISQVMNAAIRDTNPSLSIPYVLDQMDKTVVLIQNTTDQSVVISTHWSPDGVTFVPVGNTANVAAGATFIANEHDTTLIGIKLFAGQLKIVATAAVAPTSGTVIATLQGMNC